MDWGSLRNAMSGFFPQGEVQDRASILPMVKTDEGVGLGWPQMALDAYKAVALPRAAIEGYQATPEDIGNFAMTVGAGGLGSSALMKSGGENAAGMFKAYHGSPHDFDQFSMDKIGTGEGAQAYGHGLYFAENERVAKDYRDKLAPASSPDRVRADDEAIAKYRDEFDALTAQREAIAPGGALARIPQDQQDAYWSIMDQQDAVNQKMIDETIARMKPNGHMYEVNINADPDDFLDWDRPLSEQSERVRGAVRSKLDEYGARKPDVGIANGEFESGFRAPMREVFEGTSMRPVDPELLHRYPENIPMARQELASHPEKVAEFDRLVSWLEAKTGVDALPGRDAYDLLEASVPERSGAGVRSAFSQYTGAPMDERVGLSQELSNAGIPGIRYLDQGSRTAGDGSRNYVVFDDKLIDIIKKYGMAGLLASGMGANAMGEFQGPQE
jgi:hypothetical protein